jgi:hypothetical protein
VHGVAADPGYRLVVIRGGDTEHAAIKCAPALRASGVMEPARPRAGRANLIRPPANGLRAGRLQRNGRKFAWRSL